MFTLLSVILCLLYTSPSTAAPISTAEISDTVVCGEHGDCLTASPVCNERCGCDNLYTYNETTQECLLNIEYLRGLLTEKYNTEEKIRLAAEKIFSGIIISVIIFISCASFCAVSACIYCCRMNYADYKLHEDVVALSQKLNRDGKLNKPEKKSGKKPTQAVAESCNVVVEDAGVFVC